MHKANDNRRQIIYAITGRTVYITNLNDCYGNKYVAQEELDQIQLNGSVKYADYCVKRFFLVPDNEYKDPKHTKIHCAYSGKDYVMLSEGDD